MRRPSRPHPTARRPAPSRPHKSARLEAQVPLMTAVRMRAGELEAAGRSPEYRAVAERVGRRFEAFLRARPLGGAGGLDEPEPASKDVPLAALSLENARAFITWLRTEAMGHNALTGSQHPFGLTAVAQHAIELKALAKFCVREGFLPHDPLATFRVPRVPRRIIAVFTADQLRRLIREAEVGMNPRRDVAIIFFLLATGVRASELCHLTLADLDLPGRRAQVFGKGSKWRQVTFDPTTAKHLTRYLAVRGDGYPPELFVGRTGEKMTRNSLQRLIHNLGQWAGIGDQLRCSPHVFRHTFALSFLRVHPGALLHLQQQLGHTDLAMVRHYARLTETDGPPPGISVVASLGLDQPERKH
jgi:integrase/recombinase XerD